MSQLDSGFETMQGMGGTQAQALFDANFQRANILLRDVVSVQVPGEPPLTTVARLKFPYEVRLERVLINGFFGPPSGGPLSFTLAGQSGSLLNGASMADLSFPFSTWLAANTEIDLVITAANGAQYPLFILQFRKRAL